MRSYYYKWGVAAGSEDTVFFSNKRSNCNFGVFAEKFASRLLFLKAIMFSQNKKMPLRQVQHKHIISLCAWVPELSRSNILLYPVELNTHTQGHSKQHFETCIKMPAMFRSSHTGLI